MTKCNFDSAKELLDHFLGEEYKPYTVAHTLRTGQRGFIFRGQVDASWPLLPKARRTEPGSPLRDVAPQPLPSPPSGDQLKRPGYISHHVFVELQQVQRFLEIADKLGLPTPIDYHHFEAHLRDLINPRDLNNPPPDFYMRPFPDDRLLPAFALAQHHGVPTRLLDWTESPLVAAYFAAHKASSVVDEGQRHKTGRIAIFRLQVGDLNNESPVRIVKAPRYANSFLQAQRGIFTLIPFANQHFYDHERWPLLDNVDCNLTCMTLPCSEADELLRLLFRFDITRHHLMPTLDHAAQAVQYSMRLFLK